jgi:predicted RNA binding protein YcfA (HicA-like mRNA interferase family)
MTRDELIRRLRRLARERGVEFAVESARGKGGHWMVQYGRTRQAVPQARGGDLPKGTLRSILRSYGLSAQDLE